MLTYKVKQNAKGGVTIMAQLNNKGAWRKVRKFAKAEYGLFWVALTALIHSDNADAELTELLTQHPTIKMKVNNTECIAIMLKEEAKMIADITFLNKPIKDTKEVKVVNTTTGATTMTTAVDKVEAGFKSAEYIQKQIDKSQAKADRSAAYKVRKEARAARHAARDARRLAKAQKVLAEFDYAV